MDERFFFSSYKAEEALKTSEEVKIRTKTMILMLEKMVLENSNWGVSKTWCHKFAHFEGLSVKG